jgi:hypothetical protein
MGDGRFEQRMRRLARLRLLPPLLRYKRKAYYSPLQIFTFHRAEHTTPERLAEFDRLIALLHEIQDWYVPEVRSNGRLAQWIESRNIFSKTTWSSVSYFRERRHLAIQDGTLQPHDAIKRHDLTIEQLKKLRLDIASTVHGLDPLRDWQDLVEMIGYEKRQELRYEALLAQDFRDLGNAIVLLLRDLEGMKPQDELADIFDLSGRDNETGAPHWRVRRFGREHLNDHFYQLELIANDYDINPKPRGIIFTEGDEWQAIQLLFRARGFNPATQGIEFRSIHGIGNFNFDHWRGFLEYMHEKQVFVYFVIDSERGDLQQQVEEFTTTKRLTHVDGLDKVLPKRERICAWKESFEESNFTDEEIATAFNGLGKSITPAQVATIRANPNRTKGLAKALMDTTGRFSKTELAIALIQQLIDTQETRTEKRDVEEFVDEAGWTIALNHQPTHAETIQLNRRSGSFG